MAEREGIGETIAGDEAIVVGEGSMVRDAGILGAGEDNQFTVAGAKGVQVVVFGIEVV